MKCFSLFVAGVVFMGLGGCDRKQPYATPPDQENSIETISVSMKLAIPQSLQGTISRVEYIISADDMETMNGELEIEADSTVRGTVNGIKAGANRLFTLNAYDETNTLTHTGFTTADIVAGGTTTVRIEIGPLPGTAEIDGTITEIPLAGTRVELNLIEDAYPFIFTLEEFEIQSKEQIKFTIDITNVTQDTLVSINADKDISVTDNQGNFYRYEGGLSTTTSLTITPGNSMKVFVICKSEIPIETNGSNFTMSFIYDYSAEKDRIIVITGTTGWVGFSNIQLL